MVAVDMPVLDFLHRVGLKPAYARCAFVSGTRWDCTVESHWAKGAHVSGKPIPHVDYYHVYVRAGHITGIVQERRMMA